MTIPPELCTKAGPRRFKVIFIGYKEGHIGWRVRDLVGKYHFSRDVEFNENTPGRLSLKRSHKSNTSDPSDPDLSNACPKRTIKPTEKMANIVPGKKQGHILPRLQSAEASSAFAAYFCAETMTDPLESKIDSTITAYPQSMLSYSTPNKNNECFWDTLKPPLTYKEAMARPDHNLWQVAIDKEYKNLIDQKVIVESFLPQGKKAIRSRWTFTKKTHPEIIEKARLIAQGFAQRPDDYGDTYAPVAKIVSVRIIFTLAAKEDLELFTFDVKAAFLNAPLSQEVYICQIPGFPLSDPKKVLRLCKALYGLKQSSHEWYKTLCSAMTSIGLESCIVDPAVFYGRWSSPPDPSITMPADSSDLFIIIPVHVDNGLSATNSRPLYQWIIIQLNKIFKVNDLGNAEVFLGIRIERDHPNRKLWLSQKDYIADLLHMYDMDDVNPTAVPLYKKLQSYEAGDHTLQEVDDKNLTLYFQWLNGQFLYPAVCTRPDLSFTTAALGQYNANPTCTVAAAAKGVLRYLAGTHDYALLYGGECAKDAIEGLDVCPTDIAFTDTNWGTDDTDHRSFSGFAIYLYSGLVSWSSAKQKSTALSSTESEYMALTHLMKELL